MMIPWLDIGLLTLVLASKETHSIFHAPSDWSDAGYSLPPTGGDVPGVAVTATASRPMAVAANGQRGDW